jgi:Ulp1 family protease
LDKLFFPINAGRQHWVCVVVFMQEHRIQFYDSMGGTGWDYLSPIFQYVKDEYMHQNKVALPEEEEWVLVPNTADTPKQRNGKLTQLSTLNYQILPRTESVFVPD